MRRLMQKLWKLVYDTYGSKTGFLRFWYYQCLLKAGVFNQQGDCLHRQPERPYKRLVFVCVGNICRSPLAEAYAKSLGVEAASFGLSCTEGFPADPRAIEFGRKVGLDLLSHRTVNVVNFRIREGDLLIGMEPKHTEKLVSLFRLSIPITLAGMACRKPIAYIHDPYNCSKSYFDRCETTVLDAVRGILDQKAN